MTQALLGDVHAVLRSLYGVYGGGGSAAGPGVLPTMGRLDMQASLGSISAGYDQSLGWHAATADAHGGHDSVIHSVVGRSGLDLMRGRNRLGDIIAGFESRAQTLASLGVSRFTMPALLSTAQAAIDTATNRVNSDLNAVRAQAAEIVPPVLPTPVRRQHRVSGRPRRTSRAARRLRSRTVRDLPNGVQAVEAAADWLDTPYVWGGGGWDRSGRRGPSGGGFDCSGLTQYAIAEATHGEVVLPRTTYDQIHSGVWVSMADVRPGDLVFPAGSWGARGPEHVQLAAGNGLVIEAPYSGSTVKWSRMPKDAVVVRVIGSDRDA
ncbi:NlpC/P60 family protein [Nocardia sp. NPDC050793]|uniref:C40 family peptidase n=1 Tax=Nocardia sp. NPDC050793 TaxID=3155159 RepID=UPI003406C019